MAEYTFDTPKYDVLVPMEGENPNAWAMIARVDRALQRAEVPEIERRAVVAQAIDGDYDHLLWFLSVMVHVE